MIGEPRDRTAYGVAIASLGLALSVAILSIAWTAIEHDTVTKTAARGCSIHLQKCHSVEVTSTPDEAYVPEGLWIALGALGGIFVGTLTPFSLRCKPQYPDEKKCKPRRWPWAAGLGALAVFLLALTALIVGNRNDDSLVLYVVGAAFTGLLFGLFIPSPGRRE